MAAKKAATATAKAEKAPKLNRTEAAQEVVADIDGPTTLVELAEKANALFLARGGKKDSLKDAAWHVRRVLRTAEALGVVEITVPPAVQIVNWSISRK